MTNTTVTPLICGECGEGNYSQYPETGVAFCTNTDFCDHSVVLEHDVFPFLDAEETIIERDGIVCVVGE